MQFHQLLPHFARVAVMSAMQQQNYKQAGAELGQAQLKLRLDFN